MTTPLVVANLFELPVRTQCFDPVVDAQTRLLVLGSLPSEKSLANQEYYGNRQNKFWLLMSEVIGVPLVQLDYMSRLSSLLEHEIGLWDVVANARRRGSLDGNIRERNDNDLFGLLSRHPNIEIIGFNGGTAKKLGLKVLGAHASDYQIFDLPSSSPAYTLPYADKATRWKALQSVLTQTRFARTT